MNFDAKENKNIKLNLKEGLRKKLVAGSLVTIMTLTPLMIEPQQRAYAGEDTDWVYSQSVRDQIDGLTAVWKEAEVAYELGIIDGSEKYSVQEYAHEEADEIRYTADHPYASALNTTVEVVLDLLDGFSAETARGDFTSSAFNKMYNDVNYPIIAATIVNRSQGMGNTGGDSKTFYNESLKGKNVRVDIERPTGGNSGNLHVHVDGEKVFINSADDLKYLPKAVRKDKGVLSAIKTAAKFLGKLR